MLSGTSSAKVFRSTKGALDHWAERVNDTYWSWDNVYPFYKRSAHFNPPDYTKIDPSLNITYDLSSNDENGGPLEISYGNFQGPYGPGLDASLRKLGFTALNGLNSGTLLGYGTSTSAVNPKTATRDSSETSFLQLAARNSEIKIYPNALAKRILFDSEKKATGVLIQGNLATSQFTYKLQATREVIVSAGVVSRVDFMLLQSRLNCSVALSPVVDGFRYRPGRYPEGAWY
jgi:choline dehydrogenase